MNQRGETDLNGPAGSGMPGAGGPANNRQQRKADRKEGTRPGSAAGGGAAGTASGQGPDRDAYELTAAAAGEQDIVRRPNAAAGVWAPGGKSNDSTAGSRKSPRAANAESGVCGPEQQEAQPREQSFSCGESWTSLSCAGQSGRTRAGDGRQHSFYLRSEGTPGFTDLFHLPLSGAFP